MSTVHVNSRVVVVEGPHQGVVGKVVKSGRAFIHGHNTKTVEIEVEGRAGLRVRTRQDYCREDTLPLETSAGQSPGKEATELHRLVELIEQHERAGECACFCGWSELHGSYALHLATILGSEFMATPAPPKKAEAHR